MACCKGKCACAAAIAGIVAGVVLGVLYALGFVAPGVIFWAYLAVGVAGIFLAPVYSALFSDEGRRNCFCNYKDLVIGASVGTIIAAAVGLIISFVAPVTIVAIVVGFVTLLAVFLIASLICLAGCKCGD